MKKQLFMAIIVMVMGAQLGLNAEALKRKEAKPVETLKPVETVKPEETVSSQATKLEDVQKKVSGPQQPQNQQPRGKVVFSTTKSSCAACQIGRRRK